MEKAIEHLYKHNRLLISPIGGARQDVKFRCLGRIDFAVALGFESYHATPLLTAIRPININNNNDLTLILKECKYNNAVFESEIAGLRESLQNDPEVYLGGGCFGPLTMASDILGIGNLLRYSVKQPDLVKKLIAYIESFISDLAKREAKAGAKFFWIAEPVASLISPNNFNEFCGQYLKKIYTAAGIPGYLHVCGKTLKHMPYLVETGAQVLSIDSVTDLGASIRMVDEEVIIMGNIDVSFLQLATPQQVREETERICGECKNLKNFILSTGCSIMENTPQENLDTFIEAGQAYPYRSNDEFHQIRHMLGLLLNDRKDEFELYIKATSISDELVQSALEESKQNWANRLAK